MRRPVIIVAGVVGLLATACFQDLDFNADHKADYVTVDDDGTWTDLATGAELHDRGAIPGSVEEWPVPGDWNGDDLADVAVVLPNGVWDTGDAVGTFSFPKPAELPAFEGAFSYRSIPVPADYDGDGDVDAAWYRESDATWFIRGEDPVQFGSGPTSPPGTWVSFADSHDYDYPVPADYDGDDIDDLSTFNPRTSEWIVRSSVDGSVSSVTLAGNELLPFPVPADYDGVGHAQRAVFGAYGWFIEGHAEPELFGASSPTNPGGGFPAVADYDGDNRADRSYVAWDSMVWHTEGSPQTYAVPDLQSGEDWPLATGYNLRWNIARLTRLGKCVVEGTSC